MLNLGLLLWKTLLLSLSLVLSSGDYVSSTLSVCLCHNAAVANKKGGAGRGRGSFSFQGLHSVIVVDFCIFEMLYRVCSLIHVLKNSSTVVSAFCSQCLFCKIYISNVHP